MWKAKPMRTKDDKLRMKRVDEFEAFMADADLGPRPSKLKAAALAAWWMIENVQDDDPARSAIYWLVRQYMEAVR
jgi:hypothetical protein